MTRYRSLLLVETAGSVTWFAMDAFWMLDMWQVAVALAVPTIGLNALVFRFVSRSWSSWLVAGAMLAWATMNVLWMTYDFRLIGWGLAVGKVCLALGVLLLVAALVVDRGETTRSLMTRARRLRLKR